MQLYCCTCAIVPLFLTLTSGFANVPEKEYCLNISLSKDSGRKASFIKLVFFNWVLKYLE